MKNTFNNNVQISKVSIGKLRLTMKNVTLCVYWNWKRYLYHKMLPPGEAVNLDLYCQQLARLRRTIEKTRSKVVNFFIITMQGDVHFSYPAKKETWMVNFSTLIVEPGFCTVRLSSVSISTEVRLSVN